MVENQSPEEILWEQEKEIYLKRLLGGEESIHDKYIFENFLRKLKGWKELDIFIQKLELTNFVGKKLAKSFWKFNLYWYNRGTVHQNAPLEFAEAIMKDDFSFENDESQEDVSGDPSGDEDFFQGPKD